MDKAHAQASWEKLLNPKTLQKNLLGISLFITAFEMFKASAIQRPETFFSNGFDEKGFVLSDEYATEVLARSKSKLQASLLWFQNMGALDEDDLETFDAIRRHRNELAHELPAFLTDARRNFDGPLFTALILLHGKLERWWIANFEAAVNPEMIPPGADVEQAFSGSMLTLQFMIEIAFGDEPGAGHYYSEFMKLQRGADQHEH
jgi:hypothetical protein